jgi:outer membrane protein TolC
MVEFAKAGVLDVQRTQLAAELSQSRTRRAQLVAALQLYEALGDRWSSGGSQARIP